MLLKATEDFDHLFTCANQSLKDMSGNTQTGSLTRRVGRPLSQQSREEMNQNTFGLKTKNILTVVFRQDPRWQCVADSDGVKI